MRLQCCSRCDIFNGELMNCAAEASRSAVFPAPQCLLTIFIPHSVHLKADDHIPAQRYLTSSRPVFI